MDPLGVIFVAGFGIAVCWFIVLAWKGGVHDDKQRLRQERIENQSCSECGYDLRTGHERCPECGHVPSSEPDEDEDSDALDLIKLNNDWPTEHIKPIEPDFFDDPILLHSTLNGDEANLLAEQLLARGVYASAKHRQREEVAGAMAVKINYYKVVVPRAEEERALVIMDRFRFVPQLSIKKESFSAIRDDAARDDTALDDTADD